MRELNDQELLDNYAKSYTNGAGQFSEELNWPHQFDDGPANGQTIEEYTSEKYFQVKH